jgi:hypothetical protein
VPCTTVTPLWQKCNTQNKKHAESGFKPEAVEITPECYVM